MLADPGQHRWLLGIAGLACAVGAAATLANLTFGPSVVISGVLCLGLLVIALSHPFGGPYIYWLAYAFFSTLWPLVHPSVGDIPVGVSDLGVGLIVIGAVPSVLRDVRTRPLGGGLTAGFAAVVLGAALWGLLGLVHGYGAYNVVIDIRVLLYLAIGYLVGRVTWDACPNIRPIEILFVLTLVGFACEEATTLLRLTNLSSDSVAVIEQNRDIGISYFTGTYGLLFCLAWFVEATGRRWLASGVAAALGFAMVVVTLARTAWISVAAAVVVQTLLGRRSGRGWVRLAIAYPLIGLAGLAIFTSDMFQGASGAIADRFLALNGADLSGVNTVQLRLDEATAAFAQLRSPIDWLIGVGLGLPNATANHPFFHNSSIWLIAKEGILGTALFLAVVL